MDVQPSSTLELKRAAGYKAVTLVEDGMTIGLGTGSTVHFALERLAVRVREGLHIKGVPTSLHTEFLARRLGIPLTTLDDVDLLNLAIDGADQVDQQGHLMKGRGAALSREKCIADASKFLIIVVSEDKLTERLSGPIPVEVLPFALGHVTRAIYRFGGIPSLREGTGRDGPVITDNGNFILDCTFSSIADPPVLEESIEQIPGVISCGLFTAYTKKTVVVVGHSSGVEVRSY